MIAATVLALLLPAEPPKTPQPTGAFVVLDRIAAVVGDEIVLESEVKRLAAIGLTPGKHSESEGAYEDRVLEEKIVDILREKELRLTGGLDPSPKDVEERYASLAERVAKQRGISFDKVLEGSGVTKDDVKGWIKHGIQLETYTRERLSPAIKVSDTEIEAYCQGPFREEAKARGITTLPPCADVAEEIRGAIREKKLNEEIERWTEELRKKTRVVVYRRTGAPPAPPAGSPPDAAKR